MTLQKFPNKNYVGRVWKESHGCFQISVGKQMGWRLGCRSRYCMRCDMPQIVYEKALKIAFWPGSSVGQSACLSRRRSRVRAPFRSLPRQMAGIFVREDEKISVNTDLALKLPPARKHRMNVCDNILICGMKERKTLYRRKPICSNERSEVKCNLFNIVFRISSAKDSDSRKGSPHKTSCGWYRHMTRSFFNHQRNKKRVGILFRY